MSHDELEKMLLARFPHYQRGNALADLTDRLLALPEQYQKMVFDWLGTDEVPSLSRDGFSIKQLTDQHHFTIPAAVMMIAWLEYDKENALATLRKLKISPEA